MKKLLLILVSMLGFSAAWATTTLERLTSIEDIDGSATYVLGIDGTGMHSSGTSSWGKTSNTESEWIKYTLIKGSTSFQAKATIDGIEYYLTVPTSNTFTMSTTATSIKLGTTTKGKDGETSEHAVTNTDTEGRHLRINGTSGLRSYTNTTGNMAYFYKLTTDGGGEDPGLETPTITFEQPSYKVDFNETGTIAAVASNASEGATVTYASSDEHLLIIDENTGVYYAGETKGTVTVTASVAAIEGYTAASNSVTVTIVDPNAPVYKLVTNAGVLNAEDKVVIVGYNAKENKWYEMQGMSGTRLSAVATEGSDNSTAAEIYSPSDDANILTLKAKGTKWNFVDESGSYMQAPASTKNTITVGDYSEGYADASISVTEKDVINIKFDNAVANGSSNCTLFSFNSANKWFACYTGSQGKQCMYYLPSGIDVKVGSTGYATMYYSDRDLVVPDGISAWTFTATGTNHEDAELSCEKTYVAGSIIPAGTAVLLYTKNPGGYTFAYSKTSGTPAVDNHLRGTDVDTEITPETGKTHYFLADGSKGLGFYEATGGNDTHTNKAHKAYLVIGLAAGGAGAPAFIPLPADGTQGIINISVDYVDDANSPAFNVMGQKVGSEYKGIVIKNGKKFINK